MTDSNSLKSRNEMKKKKPHFVVKESKFSAKIKKRWRYPTGKHSSTRQCHKGRPAMPGPGYGSPVAVRGLHASGVVPVVVKTIVDVEGVDSKKQAVVISRLVGKRRKVALLQKAIELGLTVLNVSDIKEAISSIEKELSDRKKSKLEKKSSRKKKQKEKKEVEKKQADAKKAEEKSEAKDEKSVEEKIEKEEKQKEMIEKTLTKKQ